MFSSLDMIDYLVMFMVQIEIQKSQKMSVEDLFSIHSKKDQIIIQHLTQYTSSWMMPGKSDLNLFF